MHFASFPAYFPPWRLSLTIVLLFLWNKCVLHYDVCCWNCSVIETCLRKKLKSENFTVTQQILLNLQEFSLNQRSSTFFVQLPPCRNIAMKSPPFMISVLSKKLLYFENNRQSSQYKKKRTNKTNAIAFAEKMLFISKSSRFQLLQTLALDFYLKVLF